ncbi:MAG: branched-chain amino acid ABC transporter permease [Rhodospirillales bacterium]|nr:branched-chain amino acid ABC transporter permease [Rhodospirillales bacterium]
MIAGRERIAILLVLGLFALVPFYGDNFYTALAAKMMIFGLAALGVDVVVGWGGMISFGHAAFFGLGAYTVAVLSQAGLSDALITWPAAMLVAALFAAVIGALSLKTRGASFIMLTLAFAQMLFYIVSSLPALGSSDGLGLAKRNSLAGMTLDDIRRFYYAVLLLLVGALALTRHLARSPFGRAVDGFRQNEPRMRALGYRADSYLLPCFIYGSALTGLAGALAGNQMLFVAPDMLHWITSGTFLVIIVLGGQRTLLGPLLGAAALILLEEVLAEITEHWMMILGPLLIAIILFGSRGIAGLLRTESDEPAA